MTQMAYGFALRFRAPLASSVEVEARLRPAIESALAGFASQLVITPIYRQSTASSLDRKESP